MKSKQLLRAIAARLATKVFSRNLLEPSSSFHMIILAAMMISWKIQTNHQ